MKQDDWRRHLPSAENTVATSAAFSGSLLTDEEDVALPNYVVWKQSASSPA